MWVEDDYHFALCNGDLQINVGTASTLVLPSPDVSRNFFVARNASATANIYLCFGNAASLPVAGVGGSAIRLTPNQMLLFDVVCPQDDVFAIADAASAVVSLAFSTLIPG